MERLNFEYIKLDDLTPYENNAKRHAEEDISAIKSSINAFGMNDPIGVWGKKNIIVEGHGRFIALRELGYTEAPCIRLDKLTDEQRRGYALAHNKTAELAGWDFEKLMQELTALESFDMDAFGFDTLPEVTASGEADSFDTDTEMEGIETQICQTGDIWRLGRHRLMCGDSTDATAIARLMEGEKADLLLTDPPYNVAVSNSKGMTIQNDDMEDADFIRFLESAFVAANASMRNGAAFYIWHGETEGLNFRQACKNVGWQVRQNLVWVKNQIVLGRQDYQWKHEPCLYGWKDGAAHYFIKNRKQPTVIDDDINIDLLSADELRELIRNSDKFTTVMREDKPTRNAEHPTMKPLHLIKRQVKNSTKRGDKVLDIFGGSGTTLLASEQLDRTCYMMELDPKYCDVIIKRWEALSGQKAELLNR